MEKGKILLSFKPHLTRMNPELDKFEIEDIISDVYLKLLLNSKIDYGHIGFGAYITQALKCQYTDVYRRKALRYNINYKLVDDFQEKKGILSHHNHDIEVINNTVDKVLVKEKDILLYNYMMQELDYKDISERMDIPIGTVKNRVFLIRKMLEKKLK